MHTDTRTDAPTAKNAHDEAAIGGNIVIAPRVVFTLTLQAALSTYGVVGIASRHTGADCTHSDPRRGIEIDISEPDATGARHVTASIHVIAEYGVRVQAVTSSLQHQVQYNVERATGYVVDAINVHVSGLRVTNAD
jgi:uncharacterized alkaline shock family protein YloU